MTGTMVDQAAAARLPSFAGLALDPARALRLWRCPPLTIAAVSIAWLRGVDERRRADIVRRHLDPAEAAQAARLRLPKRHYEWLAGRLAIKHCAAAHLLPHEGPGTRTRQIRVGMVASGMRQGRPLISAPADVSLSHSRDFAIAACGNVPVGIDLEWARELAPPLAAALREDKLSADMPLGLRWTCKEAVLKCLGIGLRVDSREVMLTSWEPDGRFGWRPGPRLRASVPGTEPRRLRTWAGEIDEYFLALAWAVDSGMPPEVGRP